jgi:sulfite reductase alpha subunit-like flavoprotein
MNSSIQTLSQIRAELLKYKAGDSPTVIDDTANEDVRTFLDNVSLGDGAMSLIRGVASLRESVLREIRVLEKVFVV